MTTATTATDPRVDRWHAQLLVNLALRDAGVFGGSQKSRWTGWGDAQAATMRAIAACGEDVHREVFVRSGMHPEDARMHFAAIRMFCPR